MRDRRAFGCTLRLWGAALAALTALSALSTCGYFDPLDPRESDPEVPLVTDPTWQKTLSGGDGSHTEARCLLQSADGGFVILGTCETGAANGRDLWLAKTDADGNELWSKAIGAAGEEAGYCIRELPPPGGGYVLVGSTRSFSPTNKSDVYLVGTDGEGNKRWEAAFGGENDECGRSLVCAADGSFVVAGSTASYGAGNTDVYLIKVGADRTLQWEKAYGGPWEDGARCVRESPEGGYLVAGTTGGSSVLDDNVWLIRTDADGNMVWDKTYGTVPASPEQTLSCFQYGCDLQLTADGGCLLAGHAYRGYDFDAWLVKTDADGNEQWNRHYGGDAWDQAEAVVLTSDGGYALTGMSRSVGPWEQAWLVKTDGGGTGQWSCHFGGLGVEWGNCLQQAAAGGFVLAGYTTSFDGRQAYLVYYQP